MESSAARRSAAGAVVGTVAAAAARVLVVILVLVAGWTLPGARAHSYHMGSCPQLPPVPGFVTSRFLGRWHVLQKTSASVRCLTNEYAWASAGGAATREGGAGRGEWAEEAEEAAAGGALALLQRMRMPVPGVNHGVSYSGALTPVGDPRLAGAFTARFPLNFLGSASYVVFDTDYDTYAGVFSCQKFALWHRLSASIMARGVSLDPSTVNKLRKQLRSYGINVDDLDVIRQTCDEDQDEKGIQVHIKPNVLNTNATDILRDANAVVATAADAAKRAYDVYNTVNGVYGAAGGGGRRRRAAGLDLAHAPENGTAEVEDAQDDAVDAATLAAMLQMQREWIP